MNSIKRLNQTTNNRTTGTYYEQQAKDYLQKQGYEVLRMNYRCKCGEIDMIVQDQDYTVFVEVKYRRDYHLGYPREAVNWKKQKRIIHVATYYLVQQGRLNTPCRFDVIEVLQGQIVHLKNAFQL